VISANSRYAQSSVVVITDPYTGADILTIVAGQQVPYTISYSWYQVQDGQRIDQIAYNAYGDGTRWWVIADGNPGIMDWSSIPAGTLLRIPNG
jgi:phage tail protein X